MNNLSLIYTCTLLSSSTIWKYKEKELRYTFQRILSGLTVGASYCSIQTKIVCWRTFYEFQDKNFQKNPGKIIKSHFWRVLVIHKYMYTQTVWEYTNFFIYSCMYMTYLSCVVMEAWRYCLFSLLCELPKPGWLLAAQTESIPQLLLAFNALFWSSGYKFNLHFMLLGILKPILYKTSQRWHFIFSIAKCILY